LLLLLPLLRGRVLLLPILLSSIILLRSFGLPLASLLLGGLALPWMLSPPPLPWVGFIFRSLCGSGLLSRWMTPVFRLLCLYSAVDI
jgi:hypothetical protein